jgi:type VI secretion system protein ImpA
MTETIDATSLPPVSEAAPCGPDLDAEGDAEYMNFMAAIEGQLPAAYFAFDRKAVDLRAAVSGGEKLLARSHDVRLLVLLAKLAILDRDIGGFARWLAIAARLLADHWDDVHPRAEGGDFTARVAQLSMLNDLPVVILPLQYAPLAETQRDGVLVFRAQLLALGEVAARESENLPNPAAIERILLNADMAQLGRTLKSLQTIKSSIAEMGAILVERVGYVDALKFEVLSPLIERMTTFVHEALARRDPSLAPPAKADETAPAGAEDRGSPARAAAFSSPADVAAALEASLGYFESNEPSSAAVLLIGQARQLLGKNLYEVMKVLTPTYADNARIFVGSDAAFTVPVRSIPTNEEASASERTEVTPASSRAEALALIDQVAAHLRVVEPSSPIPYLLDRAKNLASRDFLTLLRDLLPEHAIANLKRED